MSSKIYLPSQKADDWRRLLARPDRHWRDGYSAKTAAERWEAFNGLPPEIEGQLVAAGLGPCELLLALPELKTDLPGGTTPSQTDIFALVRTTPGVLACCVEAKVAETFGPTVDEWLSKPTPGKAERLAALCALLSLEGAEIGHLRYQLLHRTAAAVLEAKRFGCWGAAMIVHSFSPSDAWLEDLQSFAKALRGAVSPDQPAILSTGEGMPLLIGWARG